MKIPLTVTAFRMMLIGVSLSAGAEVKVHDPTPERDARWFEESMPAADGVKLYTVGAAPAAGGKCPTVIMRSPYVKEERIDMTRWIAGYSGHNRRGYAVVFQHCRGCGMSEGDWIPYENEREDGLALLDFVRSLPWYNGEIFLSGGSYGASVHWAYLDTNPPDVKAASLTVQDVDRYNICYRNGFFKAGLHGGWFVKGYRKKDKTLRRDRSARFTQFPLIGFSARCWGESVPCFDNIIRNPRRSSPFWRTDAPGSGACFRDALIKSSMPVLLKTGFYDIYTDGVCEMWRELPEERRTNCSFLIDAYDHGGKATKHLEGTLASFPGGQRAEEGVGALDWFDAVRKGEACRNAPYGKLRYYALWENKWHTDTGLENGPGMIPFVLGTGVRSYTYDPLRELPVFPGSGGICFGGMKIQPPPGFRDDVISFILPAVTEQIDVRGRMEAVLTVSSDREDTCFYIRVSVDKGDGKWLLLRDDITSLAREAPYVPGAKRQLRFRFADHAFRLSAGDRLRVDVASACSQFAPHPNVAGDAFAVKTPKIARNTVFAAESKIVMYVLEEQ